MAITREDVQAYLAATGKKSAGQKELIDWINAGRPSVVVSTPRTVVTPTGDVVRPKTVLPPPPVNQAEEVRKAVEAFPRLDYFPEGRYGRFPIAAGVENLASQPGFQRGLWEFAMSNQETGDKTQAKLAALREDYKRQKQAGASPALLNAIVKRGKELNQRIEDLKVENYNALLLGGKYPGVMRQFAGGGMMPTPQQIKEGEGYSGRDIADWLRLSPNDLSNLSRTPQYVFEPSIDRGEVVSVNSNLHPYWRMAMNAGYGQPNPEHVARGYEHPAPLWLEDLVINPELRDAIEAGQINKKAALYDPYDKVVKQYGARVEPILENRRMIASMVLPNTRKQDILLMQRGFSDKEIDAASFSGGRQGDYPLFIGRQRQGESTPYGKYAASQTIDDFYRDVMKEIGSRQPGYAGVKDMTSEQFGAILRNQSPESLAGIGGTKIANEYGIYNVPGTPISTSDLSPAGKAAVQAEFAKRTADALTTMQIGNRDEATSASMVKNDLNRMEFGLSQGGWYAPPFEGQSRWAAETPHEVIWDKESGIGGIRPLSYGYFDPISRASGNWRPVGEDPASRGFYGDRRALTSGLLPDSGNQFITAHRVNPDSSVSVIEGTMPYGSYTSQGEDTLAYRNPASPFANTMTAATADQIATEAAVRSGYGERFGRLQQLGVNPVPIYRDRAVVNPLVSVTERNPLGFEDLSTSATRHFNLPSPLIEDPMSSSAEAFGYLPNQREAARKLLTQYHDEGAAKYRANQQRIGDLYQVELNPNTAVAEARTRNRIQSSMDEDSWKNTPLMTRDMMVDNAILEGYNRLPVLERKVANALDKQIAASEMAHGWRDPAEVMPIFSQQGRLLRHEGGLTSQMFRPYDGMVNRGGDYTWYETPKVDTLYPDLGGTARVLGRETMPTASLSQEIARQNVMEQLGKLRGMGRQGFTPTEVLINSPEAQVLRDRFTGAQVMSGLNDYYQDIQRPDPTSAALNTMAEIEASKGYNSGLENQLRFARATDQMNEGRLRDRAQALVANLDSSGREERIAQRQAAALQMAEQARQARGLHPLARRFMR